MILLEHLLRRREVNLLRALLLPGQIGHIVQIVIEHTALGRLLPLLL